MGYSRRRQLAVKMLDIGASWLFQHAPRQKDAQFLGSVEYYMPLPPGPRHAPSTPSPHDAILFRYRMQASKRRQITDAIAVRQLQRQMLPPLAYAH